MGQSKRLRLKRSLRTIYDWGGYYLSPSTSAGGRILIGVIAVGSGFFRLNGNALPDWVAFLPNSTYGLLQVVCGLAVLLTARRRTTWYARVAAIALAGTYALLASDLLPISASTLVDPLEVALQNVLHGEVVTFSIVSVWGALCYTVYLILEAGAHDEC
jgi:hypothetical protein